MDIAAMSIGLNQAKAKQGTSTSVMKMVLDSVRGEGADIEKLMQSTRAMERMVSPHLGSSIDMKA